MRPESPVATIASGGTTVRTTGHGIHRPATLISKKSPFHFGYHGLCHPLPRGPPLEGNVCVRGGESLAASLLPGGDTQRDSDGQGNFIYIQPYEAIVSFASY